MLNSDSWLGVIRRLLKPRTNQGQRLSTKKRSVKDTFSTSKAAKLVSYLQETLSEEGT